MAVNKFIEKYNLNTETQRKALQKLLLLIAYEWYLTFLLLPCSAGADSCNTALKRANDVSLDAITSL